MEPVVYNLPWLAGFFEKDNMYIGISFIGGLMLGLEVLWDDKALVIDLGIIRVVVGLYQGEEEND